MFGEHTSHNLVQLGIGLMQPHRRLPLGRTQRQDSEVDEEVGQWFSIV
jgi:hypothetical protein